MKLDKQSPIIPSMPMPSADLMNYFIKETKENFGDMGIKLDTILAQNAHFVSEDKAQKIIDDSIAPVLARLDNYTWYWRTIFTTLLLLVAGVIAALIERR